MIFKSNIKTVSAIAAFTLLIGVTATIEASSIGAETVEAVEQNSESNFSKILVESRSALDEKVLSAQTQTENVDFKTDAVVKLKKKIIDKLASDEINGSLPGEFRETLGIVPTASQITVKHVKNELTKRIEIIENFDSDLSKLVSSEKKRIENEKAAEIAAKKAAEEEAKKAQEATVAVPENKPANESNAAEEQKTASPNSEYRYVVNIAGSGGQDLVDACAGAVWWAGMSLLAEHWHCGGAAFPKSAGVLVEVPGVGLFRTVGIVGTVNGLTGSTNDVPGGYDLIYQTCLNNNPETTGFVGLVRV